MSQWTILCDFDGTISVEDITDSLLERFGRPGWQALEQAWKRGEIGSRDCMAQQVELLEAADGELDAHLDSMLIDRAFPQFVAATREAGVPLTVLSDGLDYAIRSILARYALDWLPVTSNRLEPHGERAWRLSFPNASAVCRGASGTCKCARADACRGGRKRVLLVGDGASDFCVAEAADFVFAKGKLIAHCVARDIPHAAIVGFSDALALLPDLIAGTLDARPAAAAAAMLAGAALA